MSAAQRRLADVASIALAGDLDAEMDALDRDEKIFLAMLRRLPRPDWIRSDEYADSHTEALACGLADWPSCATGEALLAEAVLDARRAGMRLQ